METDRAKQKKNYEYKKEREKQRQQTRNATEKTDKHMGNTVEIKLTGLRTKWNMTAGNCESYDFLPLCQSPSSIGVRV